MKSIFGISKTYLEGIAGQSLKVDGLSSVKMICKERKPITNRSQITSSVITVVQTAVNPPAVVYTRS